MRPIWLDSYPSDVPRSIDPAAIGTVCELARSSFHRYSERVAYVHGDASLTYAQLDELSGRYAAFLRDGLGLETGARVGVMCPNALPFPVALFGNLRAGAVHVSINPHYTPRELKHQLVDAGAETLVVVEGALPAFEAVASESPVRRAIVIRERQPFAPTGGSKPGLPGVECHDLGDVVGGSRAVAGWAPAEPDTLACLQYTGGTTAQAKGAALTHHNLLCGMLGFDAFTHRALEGTPRVIATAAPLYHIIGLVLNCLNFLYRGGLNLLIDDPRDTQRFVAELRRRPINAITGVNTLYNALALAPGIDRVDFSGLRLAMGGGTPIQEAVDARWFAISGVHIREGYGMSETCGLTQTPLDLDGFVSTAGLPFPGLDVSLRDDDGREVALGEAGELCVKGGSVMGGYWRREAQRHEHFTPDGHFRTGDVARMDERGYLYIVDRKKDMILVSGFSVYPVEVEEVAMSMPGVRECGCVGSPDPTSGEAVNLFVVPQPGAQLTADAVRAHCRERLVGYKVPRRVEFVEALPKTPVGKILKRELRRLLD